MVRLPAALLKCASKDADRWRPDDHNVIQSRGGPWNRLDAPAPELSASSVSGPVASWASRGFPPKVRGLRSNCEIPGARRLASLTGSRITREASSGDVRRPPADAAADPLLGRTV